MLDQNTEGSVYAMRKPFPGGTHGRVPYVVTSADILKSNATLVHVKKIQNVAQLLSVDNRTERSKAMTNQEKITTQATWRVSCNGFVHGTYRQALSYLCYLRRTYDSPGYGSKYYNKPIMEE